MNKQVQTSTAESCLMPAGLTELGLRETDIEEIRRVALTLRPENPSSIAEFGRDVAEHTAQYTDSLLAQVNNSDLNEAGGKLTKVVEIARALNIGPLSDRRSRIPVVGRIIDKIRLRGTNLAGRFETTKEQIDTLIAEVQTSQDNIRSRNSSLSEMFESVREEYRLLGIHVAAGRLRLEELKREYEATRLTVATDAASVQALADQDAAINNLDKRIGDMLALQHSAMQSLPTIRLIQANNQMLVDKFHTIREITVPAWKRQFMLSLALNEQRNAVDLANHIDNTTNDLLKSNAELLYRNSVETAKANQRLVIDVSTLKQVQDTLIKTVEDVIKIQREGVTQRKSAELQLEAMRKNLRERLTNKKTEGRVITSTTQGELH